jgi:hypothetical protein
LEFLSSTVRRVRLITEIPDSVSIEQVENVHAAALELSTAIMEYLTMAIQHLKNRLSG